ncbi:MAG: Rieske (2Fe-2S) protein [Nitrososphaeria archaeon]
MKRLQYMGYPVFVITLSDGTEVAYLDYCPHKGRPITADGFKIEGDTIVCPFHGAAFDLRNGMLIRLPVSKTPCPESCSLTGVKLSNGSPESFMGEPKMPRLPEPKKP